jgi:hypothetical protein
MTLLIGWSDAAAEVLILAVDDRLSTPEGLPLSKTAQKWCRVREQAWKAAQQDNLACSARGGPMVHLEQYADALNTANAVIAAARHATR